MKSTLLNQLLERNIELSLENDQLRIDAPEGALDSTLVEALKEHKELLIQQLKQAQKNQQLQQQSQSISTIALQPESLHKPFPLSDIQHAYWIGRSGVTELGEVATYLYFELDASGKSATRLNQALNATVQRHHMLRAVFDDQGQQRILPSVPDYVMETYTLEPGQGVEEHIAWVRGKMAQQVLPAQQWPLFDIRASQLSGEQLRLHIGIDMLIADGLSLLIFFKEWADYYQQPDLQLPPLSLSFRDYMLAEQAIKQSSQYTQARDYWQPRIPALPGGPQLPVKASVDKESIRFQRRRFCLPAPRWQQLQVKAKQQGLSASSLVLAAFTEVLSRWSKQGHYCLNLTLFNRLPLHQEIQQIMGDFTSITLLEVDHRTTNTFVERAQQTQRQLFADLDHKTMSGVEVIREWSKAQQLAMQVTMPVVFTSMLGLSSQSELDASITERIGETVFSISQTPQVWLDNQVMEEKGSLVIHWDVAEEVFMPGVLDAMFTAYGELIEALSDSETIWQQPYAVPLPDVQWQRRQQLNSTQAAVSENLLHEGFVLYALNHPDQVAISTLEDEMTYGELLSRSCALAVELEALGVGAVQADLVAVVMPKSWQQIVAVMGVLIAGGAYLPIDPELPKARIQLLCQQSQCCFAVIASPATDASGEQEVSLPNTVSVIELSQTAPDSLVTEAPPRKRQPQDLAYVIFTSGSTGVPKGVMIDHLGAVNTLYHINKQFKVSAKDAVLAVSSLSFDLSVYDIFGLLAVGGTLVIPHAHLSTAPEHWLALINTRGVTIWNSAPPLMTMLLNYMEGFQQAVNHSLRATLLSGDWLPLELKEKLTRYFPQSSLTSLGGATEASVWSIYYPVDHLDTAWKSIPYGKPLPNQTMHVLNQHLQACPDYVTGDIYIGGIGLAKGYLGDQEKTDKHFIISPHTNERLYYTGDLGRYFSDGNIEFLGREDTQVKLRGHRIELGEINTVLKNHPAISDAIAIINGDSRSEQQLCACLQLNPKAQSHLMTTVSATENIAAYSPQVLSAMLLASEEAQPSHKISPQQTALWESLDSLYFEALITACQRWELFAKDKVQTLDGLMDHLHIVERYRRWLNRALSFLVDKNILTETQGQYRAVQPLPEIHLPSRAAACEQALMEVLGFDDEESHLFTAGAIQLIDILREEVHSAEYYTAEVMTRVYQKLFPDSHSQLKRVVENVVIAKQQNRPLQTPTQKLKVLEVGAGLGSATQHLLPILDGLCETYVFTDISHYFLQRAADKFSEYEFLHYEIFNLDLAPEQQGHVTLSYDLVVASSVLHDVAYIKKTLNNLKSLLKPGGLLVLLEETKFLPSFDLTMGLMQGFDTFEDEELRQHHPLLSRDQWSNLLIQVGFADAQAMNINDTVADYVGFDVIVAQMPDAIEALDESRLEHLITDNLPAYMKPNQYRVLQEFPLTANGKIDYKALSICFEQRTGSTCKDEPSTSVEESLYRIWSEVLRHSDFGVSSNFFEVGGDSLLLVDARNKIKSNLNIELPTPILFEHPSIGELAAYVTEHGEEHQLQADSKQNETLQTIIPDNKNNKQPFPFSDLQVAFYMAGNPYMEYHVKPHYYTEENHSDFDVLRYEQALNKTFQYHKNDIVLAVDHEHLQLLDPLPPVSCDIHDFTDCSSEDREQKLMAIRQRMMREELPLEQWPWMVVEISLWQEAGIQKGRVHINANTFYLDGFSAMALCTKIDAFYKTPELTLPPLELSYRDAVIALQALEDSPQGERAKDYWLNRLADLPDPPALPQLSGVNRKCRSHLQRRENKLPANQWSALKDRASHYGLTPNSVVITAYAEILSLWSGSQHFILSSMVTRRLPLHPQMKDIVGNFASLYPLEIDLRGDLCFVEKVQRIQKQILQDGEYLQWGGMQVMQALNQLKGEFGTAPSPFALSSALFGGFSMEMDFSCLETAQTLLDHQFWELQDGRYFYVWDLLEEFFPSGMVDSMWETFTQFLEQLGEGSELWESKVLNIAPVAFANNYNCDMPVPEGLLHQGLLSKAASDPKKNLLELFTGQYSYADIDHYSDTIAWRLKVESNQVVAIVMDRNECLFASAIAILKAGAAYVPVDPNLPAERIRFLLADTKAQIVLTQPGYHALMTQICADNIGHQVNIIDVTQIDQYPRIEDKKAEVKADELAYVIYTSGSTGKPKGVMIDHRGALNTVRDINRRFGIDHKDKILGVSSFGFDLSVYDIFGVLDAGATLVYPNPAAAYNPAHWLGLLIRKEISVWNSAPPLMALLLETALRQNAILPKLRVVMLSGDWIPLELFTQLRQVAPNAQLISLGGATEASIWSIYYPVDTLEPQWSSIPYGRPLANQGWQIRDALGRQVPVWTVGELWISGIGLAKGYWGDTEKTQAQFITHSETGERFYRTGDMGRYLPDGNIEFMGRVDAQVKIQGYRIELGEIESVLKNYPQIRNAVVLAETLQRNQQEPDKNSREKQLLAFVVLENSETENSEVTFSETITSLREHLKTSLPVYMVPTQWASLSNIPLTANGKVDRKSLLAIERSSTQQSLPKDFVDPRTKTEIALAAIWSEVLQQDSLSIHHDFFDLGGRSFDAVRLVALIKEQLDKELSLGDIWEQRTIALLANYLDRHQNKSKHLVTLKESPTDSITYFMIHPGGGQVVGYYPLAEGLQGSVYGLSATAADVDNGGLASIEAIASRYLKLIRQQQAKGPYTLVGWSSGSYIAFEIAAQLEQQGESLNHVWIVDAPAPMVHQPVSKLEMLKGFFEDLGLNLNTALIDQISPNLADLKKAFASICQSYSKTQTVPLDAGQLYPLFRVFISCVNASRRYDPLNIAPLNKREQTPGHSKKIQAPITVLRAQQGMVSEFMDHPHQQNLHWGWKYLSRGETDAVAIPGTHHTILKKPNVEQVAELINGGVVTPKEDDKAVVIS